MKTTSTAFCGLLSALTFASPLCAADSPSLSAATPAASTPAKVVSEADKVYGALMTSVDVLEQPDFAKLPLKERVLKSEAVLKTFVEEARAFAAAFPTDPRRWEALVKSSYMAPNFVKDFKPEFEASPSRDNVVIDEVAAQAFSQAQVKLLEGIYTAEVPDAKLKLEGAAWLLTQAYEFGMAQPSASNRALVRKRVDGFVSVLPAGSDAETLVAAPSLYIRLLKEQAPAELEAYLSELRKSPVPALKELPDAEFKRLAVFADLAIFKFTALDGSEVDMAKLRGKVVLVDFWATWCGPCVAEIPNVKEVYQKYHDKGFEVVGISLDRSNAADKLKAFTKGKDMPWPQYYDGDGFNSKIAEKYRIEAIPTMVLLGKDGKPASLEARGPELELQVKRLLGL